MIIKCMKCSAENSDAAKFCVSCGTKLALECSVCKATIGSDAKFCPECGSKVLQSRSQNVGLQLDVSLNTQLPEVEVVVASAEITGSNDGDYSIDVEIDVTNSSESKIDFFSLQTELFNGSGDIIGDTSDAFEEVLETGDTTRFSTSLWGVAKELLKNALGTPKIVVSVLCGRGEKKQIYSGRLPNDLARPTAFTRELGSSGIRFVTGSYKCTAPDEDNDVFFELSVLLQNCQDIFYPRAKLYVELNNELNELIGSSEDYQEVNPYGVVNISSSNRVNKNSLTNSGMKVVLETFEICAVGLGQSKSLEIDANDTQNLPSDSDSELKTIYVKTEPGGRIVFGQLSQEDCDLLRRAVCNREMPERLLELTYNSSGDYREYEGVFNQGAEGEFGNVGLISYDSDGPIEIPRAKNGRFVDGAYLVYLSLSKVSIEFEFKPNGGVFDSDRLTEVCVPILLPETIDHETYGHPSGNVVIDYLYDGEPIEEYSRELIDRGYDDQTSFLLVEEGNVQLVYTNFNGDESWPNETQQRIEGDNKLKTAKGLLDRFSSEFEEIGNSKGIFLKGNIPEKKLANAIQAYANGVSQDEVILLLDDTVFGSAKEGLLITSDAIYGHQLGLKPVKVNYSNINSSDSENERLGCYLRLNELRFVMIATVDKQVVSKLASLIEKCASYLKN